MRGKLVSTAVAVTVLAGAALAALQPASPAASAQATPEPVFSNPGRIDNRYLPITAKRRCELRGTADDGTKERSVKTVLAETKRFTVSGRPVEAVVVRDNAYEDAKLVESTLDYFAQADDGTVYYFGEDVRNLRNGKLLDRKGTWLYGRDTLVLGVAMPPEPKLGQQWRLEDVPTITMESNRVEEVGMRAYAGRRLYSDVIRIQEFIQPEGEVEYKLYAPGVGTITEYPPDGRVEFAGCS